MNNAVELEGRPRPLSTGLWTIFSWLRRDYRSDSSESLSSAGSDRTVASFAFLTPARYQPAKDPRILPPPGPPSDTYKKRVHDRNLRRQYDRDITLHRKYGLYKSGETACGYDAFSLPPVRRINCESGGRWDRERRATSECFQRRLAHVPGKRRAPLPPVSTVPDTPPTSLIRRSTRKRRAPQPPLRTPEINKENVKHVENNIRFSIQMNQEKQLLGNDVSMGCKSEKYSKKEGAKNGKGKSEKSFLKQIFDSKKRNSNIDIASVKLLPSISELDKQAAEIIETCKLKAKEQNNNDNNNVLEKLQFQTAMKNDLSENWICVTCLRKYNSSINTCSYCLSKPQLVLPKRDDNAIPPNSKASDSYTQTENKLLHSISTDKNIAEEKQKLKEMLKEMKDSLPKRTKHDLNSQKDIKNVVVVSSKPINSYSTETPTLRVGSTIQKENIPSSSTKPSTSNIIKSALPEKITVTHNEIPVATQTTSVIGLPTLNKNDKIGVEKKNANQKNGTVANPAINFQNISPATKVMPEAPERFRDKKDIHTPLKISSLLNPVYVPKYLIANKSQPTNISQNNFKTENQNIDEEKFVNTKKTPENNSTKSILSDPSASPSTPQISRLSLNIENRSKIEIKTVTAENSMVLQSGSPSVIVNKDKELDMRFNHNSQNIVPSSSTKDQSTTKDTRYEHSRRRELIHQLEQAIANGEEHAAAEAAAKLAQLRLSCSVLSFSSQILSQPFPSTATVDTETEEKKPANNNILDKHKRRYIKESSVKETSPQKQIVSKIISSPYKIKTNLSSTPTTNAASFTDKMQRSQNSQTNNQKNLTDAKKEEQTASYEMITIAVLVEDREATRGPVHLLIKRQARMRDLSREAEASLGVATNLQRWIVGRILCVNDDAPVATLAGPNFSAPFYLCVVESETKTDPNKQLKVTEELKNQSQTKTRNVYTELVELEQQPLVSNAENFECGVCLEEYTSGRGVVLRECVHIFCRDCLSDLIRHSEEPDVHCPAMGCRGILQEREIRALVTPQDYERWLARGLAAAESATRNAFHCRTRDCKGWALCEPGARLFPCPVCKHINCIPCQAIHDGETCEQYISKLKEAAADINADTSSNDDGTRTLLNSLIAKGEALECPECCAIITKKWGCDWVKCSACKTEICWVTRGRRWGPAGKGDISGGCRCGVDGKRCHPSCGYCH